MGKTSIEWCDFTFNPWWGCEKISEGCKNCYAEASDRRWGGEHWGPGSTRKEQSGNYWLSPRTWNRRAERESRRFRVFCGSMCDIFEARTDLDALRTRLWHLIIATPRLDWLLLTKRPQNMRRLLPPAWKDGVPGNVWLGTTTENQERLAGRVPHLLSVGAPVHFLSYEPALGPLYLPHQFSDGRPGRRVDWVIAGAESGAGARRMDERWIREVRDHCRAAGVSFFYKQRLNERGRKVTLPVLDGRRHADFPGVGI